MPCITSEVHVYAMERDRHCAIITNFRKATTHTYLELTKEGMVKKHLQLNSGVWTDNYLTASVILLVSCACTLYNIIILYIMYSLKACMAHFLDFHECMCTYGCEIILFIVPNSYTLCD